MKKRHPVRNDEARTNLPDDDRRDFLKQLGAAGAATGLLGSGTALAGYAGRSEHGGRNRSLPDSLQGPPRLPRGRHPRTFWRAVRSAFLMDPDYIHMNTGTTGSLPGFALNNLSVYNYYKSRDPLDWERQLNADHPDLFELGDSLFGPSALAARQAQVAQAYNAADPSEVILTYNTTDGCNLVFAGTPWQPGDRIITTSFEHPALTGPIAWARDTHGVEVVTIDMGQVTPFTADMGVGDILDLFEPALAAPLPAGARQYLAFSEIFYKNGLRMPVEALCALARNYGAYSIVDSAHGFGMLPIDFQAYGADFVAGAGHKWLAGGPGTGILYVRNTGDDLPPFNLGNFFLYALVDQFSGPGAITDRQYSPADWIQLRGENNRPALYAMTDTLGFFEEIGLQRIYRRGVTLGNFLKERIEQRWPGSLWVEARPVGDPFATALTSFNPFVGREDADAYPAVREAVNSVVSALAGDDTKTYIRSVTWHGSTASAGDDRIGFRVSTHGVYNDYREVVDVFDRLVYHVDQTGLPTL